MKRVNTAWISVAVLILLLLSLAPSLACNLLFPSLGLSARYPNFETNLSLSKAPRLGETAELTCVVKTKAAADNVTIQILLPQGFTRVSGDDLVWKGNIPAGGAPKTKEAPPEAYKGGTVERKVVIKAVKEGIWEIEAFNGPNIDHIYVKVGADSATMSKTPIPSIKPGEMFVSHSEDEPSILDIGLTLSQPPPLNKTAEIICLLTVKPNPKVSPDMIKDYSTVTVQLILPEGLTLVSGLPQGFTTESGIVTWKADCPTRQESKKEFRATVKATKVGDWFIYANATQLSLRNQVIGPRKGSHIRISEGSGEMLPMPPRQEPEGPPPGPLPPPPGYMPKSSKSTLPGEKLARYGNPLVITRQFKSYISATIAGILY